ncbi:hypothetical protein SAMD00019534_073060 [Acytostelium subglobosum LB1]|uniref:hypothetical protein n=1 Tax=Acytostelium subglobosum LB1 TaxID=1410327 RepID=UPI000644E63D|nr:hypothetical protein SAMD00019534_073060 [Acytostelium subglobosum LB1]GAM24131.1 hypothetical protein SAMD00019534_073060 [Acytostelium subglobosum LB1]|eukprot:XP_012753167.1 hypothetical protein SAMD00019534_073060 [Acytostelium subglobosum LB1]
MSIASKLRNFVLSCHCGKVRLTCDMESDLSQSGRCNCSSCFKTRMWVHPVSNINSLKLTTPESNLAVYHYGAKCTGHYFCKSCGTQMYMRGEYPGSPAFAYVSINCIEGLTQQEFSAIPFAFANGLEDNSNESPKFTNHL